MATIDLTTKYLPYVDEKFSSESKTRLVTNQDFDWDGAKTVKIYKISTSPMNDYDRAGTGDTPSRYGEIKGLDATTETMTLSKDRSFTFAIDKLDNDETQQALQSGTALARQLREVVIPEIDSYVVSKISDNAGTVKTEELTSENIYDAIITATETLDNHEVTETNRVLFVTPTTYKLMKKCKDIVFDTDLGQEIRNFGVLGRLDGALVVKVPTARLKEHTGFILCHPSATVAPIKLNEFKIHQDPPMISGDLVEGRIVYDAFVLENKKYAIYLHKLQ